MSRHVLGKVYCFECNLKREEGEEIKECPDQITGKRYKKLSILRVLLQIDRDVILKNEC